MALSKRDSAAEAHDDVEAKSAIVGGITIDWSRYPVVVVRPPATPVHDEDLRAFLSKYGEICRSHPPPMANVVDLSQALFTPPRQRRQLTDAMNVNPGDCAATALVFRSATMRGLLTAILWVFKPPYPVRAFERVSDAVAWAEQQIANAPSRAS